MLKRICVFCGSNAGARPVYAEAASALARGLARRGMGLVYGGSNVGLMRILADTALDAGVEVIGVIPDNLVEREVAHNGLSRLHVVPTMHERKALMAQLSDAFVALPGGLGTFDELCEILTWALLGIHAKPCAVLNIDGYWNPFLGLLDHAVEERFLRPEHRGLLLSEDDPETLLDRLTARGRFRASTRE